MSDFIYWLVGALWIGVCLALGFYIRTKGVIKHKFSIGMGAIVLSYLCGMGILVAALFM